MTQETVDTMLRIEREIDAPKSKVYEAWTDPAQMVRWMGPGEVNCSKVEIDLKVGGSYLIEMLDEGEKHTAVGKYKEIKENEKLVFTWGWMEKEIKDTLVTVVLEDEEGKTKLTLTHENFPAKEAAEKHTLGWGGCLDKLETCV